MYFAVKGVMLAKSDQFMASWTLCLIQLHRTCSTRFECWFMTIFPSCSMSCRIFGAPCTIATCSVPAFELQAPTPTIGHETLHSVYGRKCTDGSGSNEAPGGPGLGSSNNWTALACCSVLR